MFSWANTSGPVIDTDYGTEQTAAVAAAAAGGNSNSSRLLQQLQFARIHIAQFARVMCYYARVSDAARYSYARINTAHSAQLHITSYHIIHDAEII